MYLVDKTKSESCARIKSPVVSQDECELDLGEADKYTFAVR
jgi:hypothetical protein